MFPKVKQHPQNYVSLSKGIALVKVIYGHSTESLYAVHEHTLPVLKKKSTDDCGS